MSAGDASNTKSLSLTSLLAKESRLLREAALAIPHSFSTCTFDLGYIRQAVYLCKTCTGLDGGKPKGVCGACSVACHANHEQLELFPKRHFRCDCPTSCSPTNCTLHKGLASTKEPSNDENLYGQNFYGKFCRCGRDYDPLTETETMVQCVACEDWWHESCLHLRAHPTPVSRAPSVGNIPSSPSHPPSVEDDDDDDEEDDPSSLLQSSSYDSLICGACMRTIEPLRRWAGTPGVRVIVKRKNTIHSTNVQMGEPLSSPTKAFLANWEVIGDDVSEDSPPPSEAKVIRKRSASPSGLEPGGAEPPAKKTKLESGIVATADAKHNSCIAPVPNSIAQQLLAKLQASSEDVEGGVVSTEIEGEGDVFLSHGWRERWCRCENCLPAFTKYPFLLEEESTYAPPDDPDSTASFEELGLRALQALPRDKALDSIRAFNDMRDDLMAYLRPFAENGEVVSESHIKEFFDMRMSSTRTSNSNET